MIPNLKPINASPKILIVGAGGIGCEIVKSLAIAGYINMTILDFDTVSLSNLSRQFFYSEKDIGIEKAKALVSNAKLLYPNLNIVGLFMNVLGPDFSLPFVENFDFVFCAVDNIAARRKVNQMCVLTQTMMIDCASSGKFAQSVPVVPYRSGCYDCSPGAEPSGPKITCTIRSTPENFEHCAAWAFHLFTSMFSADTSKETSSNNNNGDNNENTANQSKDIIVVDENESPFKVVFVDRIKELQGNTEMWKHRNPPSIVDIDAEPSQDPISRPRDVWSDEESVSVFKYAANELRQIKKSNPESVKSFDKDNSLHLAFTTAASNLQARAFSIEKRCSMFDAKGLVSVVEPALATTNSTISGIAIVQMERMLRYATSQHSGEENNADYKLIKSVWMAHDPNGPRLSPASLDKPNPKCPVCGVDLYIIKCDFKETNFGKIASSVGVTAPSIVRGQNIVYDADDDDGGSGGKTLAENGASDGDILIISDLDGDDTLITVIVREGTGFEIQKQRIVEKKKISLSSDSSSSYEDSDILEIRYNK